MIQEDKSNTLATSNDQFLCYYATFRKQGHPQNSEQGQGWEETDKADTLNVFDNTENRTPILCVGVDGTPCAIILRRLTPTECARLQGMPDWWCDDVPHADSAEYKMWGNGMALPNVLYVLEGIVEAMKGERNEQIH